MNQIKLEDITLNHLKILKVVDECRSFSIAAKKLGYSQALISKKVKQIEDYFGVRLLNRSPGSISLTNKGKQLIAQAYPLVNTVENLQREFQITLSFEGQTIAIGATPLLFETWLKSNLLRFQLCFPGSIPQAEIVEHDRSFSNSDLSHLDIQLNSSSAYKEEHHCTRLTTHRLLAITFEPVTRICQTSSIRLNQLDFSQGILLEEVYQELTKNRSLSPENLRQATILDNYETAIETAAELHKFTVLPDFCLEPLRLNYNIQAAAISDADEYGVYIHVPQFSEPLVVAERLVRSFRLDQENLERNQNIYLTRSCELRKQSVLIGVQQNSIGQLIASYGTKFISDWLRSEEAAFSPNQLGFKQIEIDRTFDLQVHAFDSGAAISRKLQRGELDICILDDTALLRNGADCFHDLSFSSRLVGIASYNLSGCDMSVILPKRSAIQSVYDLKGKRISTLFGSNAHRFVVTLLDLYGIELDLECTLIDEDPRTASASLSHGAIDAHVCCNTFTALIEASVPVKRLQKEQSFDIKIPSLRGIVARSQFIKEHPQFLVSYLHDLMLANCWFLSNPVQAAHILAQLTSVSTDQILQFFEPDGSKLDPTLKPQWSWLLKTLNRRLDGRYGIAKFDVDFWMDDYLLRLVYSLLDLDYHLHQISFSNELSNSYFLEEKFNRYIESFQPQLVC